MAAVECVVRLGFADYQGLLGEIAAALGVEYRALDNVVAESDAVKLLTARQAIKYCVLPLSCENGAVYVATADPFDFAALDELGVLTRRDILPVIAPRDEIIKSQTPKPPPTRPAAPPGPVIPPGKGKTPGRPSARRAARPCGV